MSLENAPDEVKLAVDLIMLLEENRVSAKRCWERWILLSVTMKTN